MSLKAKRRSAAYLLSTFLFVSMGCSKSSSTSPAEDQSVGGTHTGSGSVQAEPDSMRPVVGAADTPTYEFREAIDLINEASVLPRLDAPDSSGIIRTVMAERWIDEVEDDSTDGASRLSALFGKLRKLDSVLDRYRHAVTIRKHVGADLIALVKQRSRLSAAGGRVANRIGELTTGFTVAAADAVETERATWMFTLSWHEFAETLSPPVWSNLDDAERSQLVNVIRAAIEELSPVTYEAFQSALLQDWPVSESLNSVLLSQLEETRRLLADAQFAPHVLGNPADRFDLSLISLPEFPELGEPHYTVEDDEVQVWEFRLHGDNPEQLAGYETEIRVLMPAGEHPDKSLPCIFRAPAGTGLESGNDLDLDEDTVYLAESIPLVEAGFVVVEYSLDGEEPATSGIDLAASRLAYLQFRAACAGMVNARNAIEFAIQRIPSVNPNSTFVSGHSSAGTVALLAAAHDLHLQGAIAFAPVTDVAKSNYSHIFHDASFKPAAHSFRVKSSPLTHIASIQVPVFLFHSEEDDVVAFEQSETFAKALKEQGGDVTLVKGEGEDHYATMIEEGIPAAIEWLKKQAKE